MDCDPTSYELLAHFDSLDDVAAEQDTRVVASHRVRDARWVLKWAAAFAILVVAAATLLEFGYLMAAERMLNFAARAGAMEATLPRATYDSVLGAVERRLAGYSQMQGRVQLTLLQDGKPVGRRLQGGDGVRFSVVLQAPASAAVPSWLIKLTPWRTAEPLLARADRTAPGRSLQHSHL